MSQNCYAAPELTSRHSDRALQHGEADPQYRLLGPTPRIVAEGRHSPIRGASFATQENVLTKDRNLSTAATMILSAKINLSWNERSSDCLDALRPNTRQVVKDLLFEISQADDLRRGRKDLDAPPCVGVSILRLVDNDQWMSLRGQPT